MKVLSGVYPSGDYEGKIIYRGKECHFRGIHDSEHKGIVIIHQELALVPMLSIAENIFLGNEHAKFGVIDWDANEARTRALLEKVGLNEDPKTLITNIGTGKQQLVEIAKALSKEVELLILDEPTASLSEKDSQALLDLLLEFKRQGITSIIISHKLNEINRVADHVTVIRDGQTIETLDARRDQRGPDHHLDGRPLARGPLSRRATRKIGEVDFEVKNWSVYHPLHRRPAGDQEHRHQRPQGRGRRHCRPDGRRPHRIRHEPVRPLLWPPDHRRGLPARQEDRYSRRSARRSSRASPMSPRTARPTAST